MAQFIVRPMLIEAIRCKDALNAIKWEQGLTVDGPVPTMPQWLRDAVDTGAVRFFPGKALINTMGVSGEVTTLAAREEDWIISNGVGAISSCPDRVFQEMYEAV